MALLRPYCALLDVQKETKASGSEHDAWYQTCINLASRWAEEYCQRDWWFHDHSADPLEVDRRRVLSDEIYLPFPILTISELSVDDSVWIADDFHWMPGERGTSTISSDSGAFGPYPFKGTVKIKGTFGYALEVTDPTTKPPVNVPAGVRRAVTIIAAAFSSEKHIEQVGLDGSRVELLDTAVPNEAKMLLRHHKALNQLC